MKIASESRIHHPVAAVYAAYRDRLPELAAYIPDIKEIQVLSREETDDGLKLLNMWIADRELPRMVQGIVKPEMTRWEDHANWIDAKQYVDWTIVIPAFRDQVTCYGRNSFVADGPSATRVVLTGDLNINLKRIPGVPRFMAGKLVPQVEAFIVKLITPNLARVNQSLEQFLDAQG